MIQVFRNYEYMLTSYGRIIGVRLTFNEGTEEEEIIVKDNIKSLTKDFTGNLFKTYLQYIECTVFDLHVVPNTVRIEFGLKLLEFERFTYIDWGTYTIDTNTVSKDIGANTLTFTAYDHMIDACVPYTTNLSYDGQTHTVKEILLDVCNTLNFTLERDSFLNDSIVVKSEKYISEVTDFEEIVHEDGTIENIPKGTKKVTSSTFRDVLEDVAEISGTCIYMIDKVLYLKSPTEVDKVLNGSNNKSMSFAEKFGPVTKIMSVTEPAGDSFEYPSGLATDITTLKFSNNLLMSDERELSVRNLFDKFEGFEYYPFKIESWGFGYFEPGDVLQVEDLQGVSHTCVILNDNIVIKEGLTETLSAEAPKETELEYSTDSTLDKIVNNNAIAQQRIEYTLSNTIANTQAQFRMMADEISAKVSKGDDLIAEINLNPGTAKISANKVNLTGLVTIENLATAGATEINGANITTGTIKSSDTSNNFSLNMSNGKVTMKDGDFSGTIHATSGTFNNLQTNTGYYVHSSEGARGQLGFVKLCTITFSGTSCDFPIRLQVSQKLQPTMVDITIMVSYSGGKYVLEAFNYSGVAIDAILYGVIESNYTLVDNFVELYIRKLDAYDVVSVVDFNMSPYMKDKVTIEWIANSYLTEEAMLALGFKMWIEPGHIAAAYAIFGESDLLYANGQLVAPNGYNNPYINYLGGSTFYTLADYFIAYSYVNSKNGVTTLPPKLVSLYDFNGNGRVDSSDVATLENILGI